MTEEVFAISGAALDRLMPMHLVLDADGRVRRAGPTFCKLAGIAAAPDLVGRPVLDLLALRRPRPVATAPELLDMAGQRLALSLRSAGQLRLRGLILPLPDHGQAILNLSLGVSFAEAVDQCDLTLGDFSPCDQTVDLLYLREAISATARVSRQLTERLQAAQSAAEHQALTDTLTGLGNRRAMDRALSQLLGNRHTVFGLMHLDLDHFKAVNDTLGHAAGDHVLTHVADILRSEIREGDLVARVGGDEFVLLFRDCDDPALLGRIAARMIARLEEPSLFDGQPCRISASIGTTLSSFYEAPTMDRMLLDADVALYASKNRGRARHTIYAPSL